MYTDKELFIFAEILERNCKEHLCYQCPFRQCKDDCDKYDCRINSPYKWELKKEE